MAWALGCSVGIMLAIRAIASFADRLRQYFRVDPGRCGQTALADNTASATQDYSLFNPRRMMRCVPSAPTPYKERAPAPSTRASSD